MLPDILICLSDQHHGRYLGYAGHPLVRTPALDRIAASGTAFENAYTSCPLCVPARTSLLTGGLPSRTGVFGNQCSLPSDQATFLHALAIHGYETVLCGKMHFVGPDQRHGFARRIHPEFSSSLAGRVFRGTSAMKGCANLAGGGNSPVLEYDRSVVRAAEAYLEQDHEKPQCIVVGTLGPHFPYVAPTDLFQFYRDRVSAPASWSMDGRDENPLLDAKRQRTRQSPLTGAQEPMTTEIMLAIRAAYLGMITEQDRLIGEVHDRWTAYLRGRGRPGVFVYLSDHGDTCGEHGIFGKQTFYEGSAHIPLLFEGAGIQAGTRLRTPASIMDIGPTLCALVGAETIPFPDGESLAGALRSGSENPERTVIGEWVQEFGSDVVASRMIRSGPWKLSHYRHPAMPDQLFNLDADPEELRNLADAQPEVRQALRAGLERDWDFERIAAWFHGKRGQHNIIARWRHAACPTEQALEAWMPPGELHPEIVV